MNSILLAGIQVQPRETKQETLQRTLEFVDNAGRLKVSVASLNDYFLSWPPDPEKSHEYVAAQAEPIPGPSINALQSKAKEYGMMICSGSIIEKDAAGKYYVSAVIIGKDGGVIAVHRKTELFNGGLKFERDSGISAGTPDARAYDTPLGKMGIILDTEVYNRNIIEEVIRQHPKLVFWPVSWTVRVTISAFGDHQITARYISRQSKAYVISTNKVGLRRTHSKYNWAALRPESRSLIDLEHVNQVLYPGGTVIVSKSGTVIGAAEEFQDGMAVASIDLNELK